MYAGSSEQEMTIHNKVVANTPTGSIKCSSEMCEGHYDSCASQQGSLPT